MKKYCILLIFMVFLSCSVFAGEIILSEAKSAGVAINSVSSGGDIKLNITCSIDKLQYYDVDTPKGEFTVLYSPEFYFGGRYGTPQLPVINKMVQIPFGADYTVEIKSYDSTVYDLEKEGVRNQIFPRQPSAPKDGSEVPFVYEHSAYIFKGFNGEQMISFENVGTMRHMRLAQLSIAPIKYHPIDRQIIVYNNINVEIKFIGSDMKATKAIHNQYWSPAFAWMDKMVTVPDQLRFGERNVPQTYVIVSDPMFKEEILPFANWKTEQGFVVDLVFTDKFGTGNEVRDGVKDYIHNMYLHPHADVPPPSYVLFVGDHGQIPAFQGRTGSHITDLYYVSVNAGDFLPDILTGRFSANNVEELIPQIEKTMEYEKFLFPDPSFLDDVVLIAGWDSYWAKSHGWAHLGYLVENYINKENGYKNINLYLSTKSNDNTAAIVADVAKGAAYVNYTAHGSTTTWADPQFTISDVKNLGNKGKYPLVIGNCCITNRFELTQCFGESWLRAKDSGAIGYVGGSNSTYWHEDFWWGVGLHSIVHPNPEGIPPAKENTGPGAFEAMFEGPGVTNAGFMVAGNLAVEESTSSRKHYYWEIYHLMGDPALTTYMKKPKAMRASYNNVIDANATSIQVSAPSGSYIGISHNSQLLGSAYVDSKGQVDIPLSSLPKSGEAKVVVTAANAVPHIGSITIK